MNRKDVGPGTQCETRYSTKVTLFENEKKIQFLLKYFQFLLKLLVKSQFFDSHLVSNQLFQTKVVDFPKFSNIKRSKRQNQKIFQTYNQMIYKSQISLHLNLKYKFVVLTKHSKTWLIW